MFRSTFMVTLSMAIVGLFACAAIIALGGGLCPPFGTSQAASSEGVSFAVFQEKMRVGKPRGKGTAASGAESSDAKRFAERIKRHQGRHLAKRKREFRNQQLRLESQRSALKQKRARAKAHQFAAARRHAALSAQNHRRHADPGARSEYRSKGGLPPKPD